MYKHRGDAANQLECTVLARLAACGSNLKTTRVADDCSSEARTDHLFQTRPRSTADSKSQRRRVSKTAGAQVMSAPKSDGMYSPDRVRVSRMQLDGERQNDCAAASSPASSSDASEPTERGRGEGPVRAGWWWMGKKMRTSPALITRGGGASAFLAARKTRQRP
ncbi:hypothetical protein OH76DRAFT_1033388 [Lentinus brumalis]|uniref:Uncharacterized protein n=1 Tax=Lentinus brumalis TaxID=2498619 RepID=A0A371CXK9_9APHY|nr:hypothetical protein OH76DRAFT_1033388 [Polyporus brumalis]